ncbi:MAG TPA: ABC transporter permease [Pseudonocardiaceae bacterium]|jgi:ABC-2 type transport system permease protein
MTTSTRFAPGTFTPAPGRGSKGRMLYTQARIETLLALRNGEQVLLTLLIPLALLIGLTLLKIIPMPSPRVDSVTPRVFALAVMSSAFTGQAIALGFDRRYGVLKRLAATALPRWLLVSGRLAAAVTVVVVQIVVLGIVAAILGWSPDWSGVGAGVLLIALGTLAFGALGVLLGGSLRAEIVLALANIIWFVLLLVGGAGLAASSLPAGMHDALLIIPSGALAEGLYSALGHGGSPVWVCALILLGWGVLAGAIATRTTKLS